VSEFPYGVLRVISLRYRAAQPACSRAFHPHRSLLRMMVGDFLLEGIRRIWSRNLSVKGLRFRPSPVFQGTTPAVLPRNRVANSFPQGAHNSRLALVSFYKPFYAYLADKETFRIVPRRPLPPPVFLCVVSLLFFFFFGFCFFPSFVFFFSFFFSFFFLLRSFPPVLMSRSQRFCPFFFF